jgi:uncharacterized Rmd1/YagE family protein
MSIEAAITETIYPKEPYPIHAYSIGGALNLKDFQDKNPDFARYSSNCLILELVRDQHIFIFSFGTIVFFNINQKQHEDFLHQYGLIVRDPKDETAVSSRGEDAFTVRVEPESTRVNFNSVVLPGLELSSIHLVALALAQSSALEFIEITTGAKLKQSEKLTDTLKARGLVRRDRRELLQRLGEILGTKHTIVDQLSVFSEPEKTWSNEHYYNLYRHLRENFEIDRRLHQLERMLDLSSDSIQLMVDIADVRRLEILEIIIILLIAVEVVKSMFYFLGTFIS